MAVMAREKWTDERLDDLNLRMERGFDEVKGEIRELRREANSRFDAVDARFTAMDTGLNARFDSLQRTMVIGAISMSTTIVGALLVTQL